jgi:hypothetical protein
MAAPSPAPAQLGEPTGTDLPHALVLVTATTCGVMAAMVAQVLLARRGIELANVWRDLVSSRGLHLRGAGAWWVMAASGFLVGAAVAGAISRLPVPWVGFRLLRWIVGAAVVFALAHVGHSAALKAEAGGAVGVHVAASFGALCAAALMALFGAYFAAKR